jgi:hypothetical protein
MKIAFFGSSPVSSCLNGRATCYCGLPKGQWHNVTFFKPEIFSRQRRRDIPGPRWAGVAIYPATSDSLRRALAEAVRRDLLVGASCVGVFDAELRQAEEVAELVVNLTPDDAPDRRCGRGPRSCASHLRTSCPRRRRSDVGDDAEGRGRSMIFNVVPLRRRSDLPRVLSGYLRFFRHAWANQASVHETRPPQCKPSDTRRRRTNSGVRCGMPADESNDVCYFLCKTSADRGEPARGMLVSAAKSNIKVGIQTYSRWSRGKYLTLEELL